MTPPVAAALCGLGILGLIYLDSDRKSRTSPALWIPVVWACLGSSRMVSQWLGFGTLIASPDQYLSGSPIDRPILSGLLAVVVLVLLARGRRCETVLRANGPLLLFFLFGAASVLWSDFPWVTFKRWTKSLGNVAMVLVVLTDANPAQAIRQFFARTGFLLIPISVVFITHFPHLGRGYHWRTGAPFYTGVTTDKNSLGAICLVFGLAALWRLVEAFRETTGADRMRTVAAFGVVLGLNLWLMYMARSSTALVCFLLGAGVILGTAASAGRQPATVHGVVGGLASVGLLAYLLRDPYAWVVSALGEEMTLSGRTILWADLLHVELNPWLGTGFETFWLGDRARFFWDKYFFRPNQAHNGYLETYLTLGWVGVALLLWLIASGYRNIIDGLRRNVPASTLKLAFLIVAVVYSLTEAAFKVMHPVWIAFLFAIIAVPHKSRPGSPPLAPPAAEAARPVSGDRALGSE